MGYTYSYIVLNILVSWPVRDQEFHVLVLDLTRRWSDVLMPHYVSIHCPKDPTYYEKKI